MSTKADMLASKYKYTILKEWTAKVNGTHLQGYVTTTRRALEQMFGEPLDYSGDDFLSDGKVTTEWLIEFDDGVIATVYDYKRYEVGPPALDESYTWHIGGHDSEAFARIQYLTPPF
jgi:hypothetical protein